MINLEIQRKIAQAVADGATIFDIETRFGIPLNTVRAIRRSPDFIEMVEDFARDTRESAKYKLLSATSKAVDELIRYLGHPDVEEKYELTAIELILGFSFKETAGGGKKSLKGVSKQTIEDIRNEIIKKRV